jgi:hypothetical protein
MSEEHRINPIIAMASILSTLDPHNATLSEDDLMRLNAYVADTNALVDDLEATNQKLREIVDYVFQVWAYSMRAHCDDVNKWIKDAKKALQGWRE